MMLLPRNPAARASSEALVNLEDLAVDVVVAHVDTHGVRRDRHAFDDDVRVVHEDVAVLAGTRLAFVGVADEVLLTRELARHEAPLQARGETSAAATAQSRILDGRDHLVLGHPDGTGLGVRGRTVHAQHLAQGLVATARLVVLERPVAAVQVLVNLGVDVAAMETGLHAGGAELGQHLLGVHCLPSEALRPSIS
jgi:hypothetical protein